ncbi:chromosomal replication initiator protein DnaA [Candidatus Beckwithbacteria bacterium CG10_big_fil_rev_8_21_14_0_10_34_10]|uniref:Chromosomal replication initiator protein DnaA n=1 Tax=Candidatus Beckwithbacteria bacterium CG10_big_fil_rev_8_21_14_0_10_34_10 TaxID=1974495 RepID=A0A2H0W8C7_9BACT|nr:MAG: chromosomal replication initiator protein DnaA [Candidatus Beckwithbacteria bacterium CG10_big_fil_rev_8_21_14_0_10_34_10]
MNKKELWQAVLAELQLSLSKANFSAWFSNTRVLSLKKLDQKRQLVEIGVSNPYVKNTIELRYQGQIKEILDRLTKLENELGLTIKAEKQKISDSGPLFKIDFAKEEKRALQKAIESSRLRPDFTFDTFAVSSSNDMAHAAACAVANDPGKKYHLLFLYGGVGVGKTHLTHAVGHQILAKNPHARVVYCTSEEFTNEIVEAIQRRSTSKFRQKYRSAKALLIDDIQFIGGKETIQEEFFHTFNAIHAEGGQIVLTSDHLPHEIKGLEGRLRSRFEGGLTIDVQEPNFELRTAILLIKANQRGIKLPIDVAKMVASNIKSTRRLEGFLTRLVSEGETRKKSISLELCQTILERTSPLPVVSKRLLKPNEILDLVARYFELKISELKGPKRSKPIVVPRQIAMYLIRTELEDYPLMEIGRLFGGRDHTTVMHSVDKIKNLLPGSEELRSKVDNLKKRLYG